MIAIGERIGDYLVERELSRTPAETVYVAVHVLLPRRARLRVLAGAATRMMRESCVLEALRHPMVPRVYECGMLPDKRPWLASELVEGHATSEMLLSVAEVVAMLRDVGDVLAHAHARGVVHKSLSPEAIVHGARGICVTDWADARIHDTDGTGDINALGAIAYQALFGIVPPTGSRRWVGVPAQVVALVERMLDTDKANRPTAADVRDEAARLATDLETDDSGVVDVELVALGDEPVDESPPPKPRWTPPLGYASASRSRVIARANRR